MGGRICGNFGLICVTSLLVAPWPNVSNTFPKFQFQTVQQNRELTEGLSHMEEALQQFAAADEAGADSSSITDNFLEPLSLTFTEPDFSRLEKPAKPPVPEVISDNLNSGYQNTVGI